jgi:hypothetical protein
LDPTGAGDAIGFQLVYDDYPAPFSDPLNDETWIAVEMHAVGGTPIDTKVYVEGSLERDDNPGHSVANWEGFTVGIRFAAPDSRQVIYIRQVKVGTTRGGSEIFEDDFSGGDLSAWSSTSGDVSVVEEPGEGSPAAIHIWKRF